MTHMPQLRAERQLQAIEATSVPHMTEQGRRPIVERLMRRVRPQDRHRTAGEALATLPIPVEYVPAPPKGGES